MKRSIEPRPVVLRRQELLENRYPEFGDDIDRHHTKQGNASHSVDRGYAIRWRNRALRACRATFALCPSRVRQRHMVPPRRDLVASADSTRDAAIAHRLLRELRRCRPSLCPWQHLALATGTVAGRARLLCPALSTNRAPVDRA